MWGGLSTASHSAWPHKEVAGPFYAMSRRCSTSDRDGRQGVTPGPLCGPCSSARKARAPAVGARGEPAALRAARLAHLQGHVAINHMGARKCSGTGRVRRVGEQGHGSADEQEIAHLILSHSVPRWKMGALIELALQMEIKAFLDHRHCQSLMDLRCGGYSGSSCGSRQTSRSPRSRPTLMPMINPYVSHSKALRSSRQSSKEEREQCSSVRSQALVLEAFACLCH